MHLPRTLTLIGAALLLFALVASASASAVTLRTGSATGTPLPVGSTVTGVSSGNVILSGTFFGVPQVNTCTGSTMSAVVQANSTAAGNAWMKVNSYTWTGCTTTAYPGGCTVVMRNLPWDPTINRGGMEAISSTSVRFGTGDVGVIDWSDCAANKSTCTFRGLTAGPVTDGSFGLTNYISGTWTNGSTNAQLAFNSALGVINCTVTSTNWTGTYRLTTSSGQQIYLG